MTSHKHEPSPAEVPAESDWESRGHIQSLLLIVVTAAGLYLCYRLLLPFLPALTWALALAVLFTPLHRWIETKQRRPSVAAGVSVVLVALIVAVPATLVGQRLIMETVKGVEHIKTKVESGTWRRSLEAQPRLAPLADWIERTVDVPGLAKDLAAWVTKTAGAIVKGSMVKAVGFCLIFYILFYFLRDRRVLLQSVRSLSPLTSGEMDRLLVRIGDTIYATVYGILTVAGVQGLLGGLMFWWLGLPTPLLWGVVMGLLAVVPVLGAFIVWIPAAIFLALDGSWGKALILTVWGGVVVAGIDNLLYPYLVGNRLKMHTVIAFISLVGGLIVFGASGLILGPVVLTITMVLVEVWRHRGGSPSAAETHATARPTPAKGRAA